MIEEYARRATARFLRWTDTPDALGELVGAVGLSNVMRDGDKTLMVWCETTGSWADLPDGSMVQLHEEQKPLLGVVDVWTPNALERAGWRVAHHAQAALPADEQAAIDDARRIGEASAVAKLYALTALDELERVLKISLETATHKVREQMKKELSAGPAHFRTLLAAAEYLKTEETKKT